MNALHRKIMRGIYFAYILRLISLPGVGQSFLMLGIVIALSHFVSPGNVFKNMLEVRLGELGSFLYSSLLGTEGWTLLLSILFVLCLVSIRGSFANRYQSYSFAN